MRIVSDRLKPFVWSRIGLSGIIFLVFGSLYFFSAGFAIQSSEPEQEPNETVAQANQISIPGQRTGTAKYGDPATFEFIYNNGPKDKIEDFFKFTIPPNQTKRLDIVLRFDNPAVDLDLFLFSEEGGNLSALAVSNGSSTTERITPIITLGPGNYVIGVSSFDDENNKASANYTLSVTPDTAPPPPVINSISPVSAVAGGGPFSLTINGNYFYPGQSVVMWNGQNRTTTFITDTRLVAFLSASDIASAGTAAITVFNPDQLGGQSNSVNFHVLPAGSADLETEPNETSQQANLLLVPGKRTGTVAVGDTAQTVVQMANGQTDAIEDLYAVNLDTQSRLDIKLDGSNPNANLALYLMKETANPGQLMTIDDSRMSGPNQRITTAATLAPGRYLVGVSAVTGSSGYIVEAGFSVPSYEADVSPRPNGSGDGTITTADWTQIGRFVAGLDTPAAGSEFQRADVAPKSTLGDGRLTIADWVMAGLYASGLESPALAGGPSALVATLAGAEKSGTSVPPTLGSQSIQNDGDIIDQQGRSLRIKEEIFQRGQNNDLKIELVSGGNENALGFSINFDLSQLSFVSASLGSDAAGAFLNVNTSRISEGRLGFGLALPSGQTFASGVRQIIRITFNVPQNSSVNQTTFSFGDLPVAREVVDVSANVLPATYSPGVITLNPPVNVIPVITSLDPGTVVVGGPSFTLTVNGNNFVNGAIATVNGAGRVTQFISDTQLKVTILQQDIAEAFPPAIAVQNPAPNGGLSNIVNLNVINPVPALLSLEPSSAAVGGQAFTLTVNGANFVIGSKIQFNGNDRITTFVSGNQLRTQITASDIATAGTATVRVITPEPGGGQSNTIDFPIQNPNPLPRLASISPDSVFAGGAAFTLTVNGSNFVNNSVVRLNGNPLTTTFVSNTQLTAQVAAENIANAGTANITVANPSPGGGNSNIITLTISVPPNPVPALTALNPSVVTAGGPQFTLAITGSNFVSKSVVRFNGQDRTTIFVSSTELRAVISANDIQNGGAATITVFNPAPSGGLSNELTLTINFAAPTITLISPNSTVAGSQAFTLSVVGTNFAPGTVVRWNGENRPTTVLSVTELTAEIPASDIANIGSATVTVFSSPPGGGLSNSVTFTIRQADRPLPRITTINPDTAVAGGAAFMLIVNGTNFVSDSVVRWNGLDRPTSFVNSTQLTAQIPAADIASTGSASVRVFTPPAGGGESNTVTFTITTPPNPVPVISGINPSTVNAGGPAFTLTINGSGFNTNSTAQFNEQNRPTKLINETQLTIQITASDIASAGTAAIRVINPAPGGGTSNVVALSITNPVPTITSIDPTVVAENSGAFTLTINGTGFAPGAMAKFNGENRFTTFVSSSKLTVQALASDSATAGVIGIQVSNPEPGGGLSNVVQLEVKKSNPLPRISTISPDTVNAGSQSLTLMINGQGFVNGSVARVNGQDRPAGFINANTLSLQLTAGDLAAAGTLTIGVFNPEPGGGRSNIVNLTIVNPKPRVTSISPDNTPAGGPGFALIVNGEGFVGTSVVNFNGIDLPTTLITNTQLSAQVPASALISIGIVPVGVFNPTPGGGSSDILPFTITNPPAPQINTVIPALVIAGGPSFTMNISGLGFVNGSVARINGQDRLTTVISGVSLTAVITAADIANAGTATIVVANPGGTVSNAFTLSINNPTPVLTSLVPGSTLAGSAAFALTINGTGFIPGSVAQWNGTARVTTFVSPTQLTAQITAADVANVGTANVVVANPGPGGGTSNTLSFSIVSQPNPSPTLTGLSPNAAIQGSGAFVLTVNGSSFVPGVVVQWNGSARATTFVNDKQLTAQIDASDVATAGTANITAVNPSPGGGTSNALAFTVTPTNPVPALTNLNPNTIAAGSAAFTLAINGSNFVPGSVVNWNGSPRVTAFVSSNQLTAQITAADVATAGTAAVVVINPAPGGGTSNTLTFSITVQPNPVPSLTSLNPPSTFAGADPIAITVSGANFIPGSIVLWNGNARPTTFVSSIQLTVQISAEDLANVGTANVTVSNPAPGGGLSNTVTFAIDPLVCNTICLKSAVYYSINTSRLPNGFVLIGGVNSNSPVLVQTNMFNVVLALKGGSSPLQQLNQQFVSTQLSVLGSNFSIDSESVRATLLRCYGVTFDMTLLGNGFILTRSSTFGDLLDQARLSIVENRTDDMAKIAAILALLNGNDPTGSCR